MDTFYKIVALLGGLAMFLYGMQIMGDGLKSSSGTAMKAALAKVTNKPYMGFLLGVLVTCMIQSSTATIVLTVGLVGAGFLTFRQSVGIVLGANVGTSITAQIIRLMDVNAGTSSLLYFFKSDNLAPMALIIGIILIMFIKTRSAKNTGTIFVGFGILFVGLMNMSASVSSMGDSLSGLLLSFENNYFLGFLAGVGATAIIQSSSAVVGILQSLASSVGVKFCAVFSVILGVNIGDCLTTYFVCRIGATKDQIRTVLVHVIYNVLALILLVTGLVILRSTGILGDSIWYAVLDSGGVANVHGLFRIIPALVFLPFANGLASIAEKIVKDGEEDEEEMQNQKLVRELDERLLDNPALALQESHHLIAHMGKMALKNYTEAISLLGHPDQKKVDKINSRESSLDRMSDAANNYLVTLSPHIATDADENNQNYQMKAIICFERIGDLCTNIMGSINNLNQPGSELSVYAKEELPIAFMAVNQILGRTVTAFDQDDLDIARKIEPLEEVIDEVTDELKERHIARVKRKVCNMNAALDYQEILQNLERISDQCSDLGVYFISKENNYVRGMEHRYIHNLHHRPDETYAVEYEIEYDRYFDMLRVADIRNTDTMRQQEAQKADEEAAAKKTSRRSGKNKKEETAV